MRRLGWRARKSENRFGFMSAQIIADDVDRLLLGQAGKQLFQKRDELCTSMTGSGVPDDFAAGGMQCRVERERAVTIVLKTVAFGPAWAQWQNRVETVQGLDSALFVHTEDCGIERRLLIKTDDIESFFFKLRIVTCHIAPQSMGLDSSLGPNSRYSAVRNSQLPSQLAGSPMSRTIRGRLLGGTQNLRFQTKNILRNNPASMPGIKPRQTLGFKTLPPARDKLRATAFQEHNPLIRLSFSQPQNYPGTAPITGFYLARAGHFSKHSSFVRRQFQASCQHASNLTYFTSKITETEH